MEAFITTTVFFFLLQSFSFPSTRFGSIMGSMDDEHPIPSSRKQHLHHHQQQQSSSSIRSKLKLLLIVISSNLMTILLLSSSNGLLPFPDRIHLWDSESLLRNLNSTRSQIRDLHRRLHTSNSLIETLLSKLHGSSSDEGLFSGTGEIRLALGPHKLPLGFNPQIGSDQVFPSLGSACRHFKDDFAKYMDYPSGGECPSDDVFAQRLMLKGCEPLPRRRCRPKIPSGYIPPSPLPSSLWSLPPDSSILWHPYTCKNYSCLVQRGRSKQGGSYDCKDCFDLEGREKSRWLADAGGLDYSIDGVLAAARPPGSIRIGLDIGGGSGTFAARMRERGVTIVTTSMNFDGPFNSFIASRGLLPLHLSVAARLPFFEGTLDIVHSMHVLSNWIPDSMLELALFDIFRVLRPGGLFWLDHFFCLGPQLNSTYVPMIDGIGFRRIRWHAGRKLDRGIDMNEWYLSALLEKPISP